MKIEDIKNSKAYDDIVYFDRVTKEAFGFLVTDYACQRQEPILCGSECLIKYCNTTTCVHITWEWQYSVVVALAQLKLLPDGGRAAEAHDLEHLLSIRAQDAHVTQKNHPDRAELKRVIDTYAALTRQYADDILKGDFSVFPQLRVLSLESIQRKKNMLGYPKS